MVPPEVAQSLRRIITEGYAYLPVDGDPGQQGSWMRPDVNNADVKRFILAIARERDEPWRQEVMNMHGLSSDDAWMWAIEKARLTNRWRLSASLTDLVGISRELEIRKSPLASLTNSLARGSVSFPPCWTKHVSWNVDKADPFKCRLIGEIHMSSPSPAGLAYIVMDGSIRQDAWAIDFATKVARTGRKHGIFLILSKEWQDAPAVPFVGGFTARIADTQDVRIIGIGSEEETVPTMAAESMIARGHAFKSGSLLES
jgi:hypothetical protein